MYPHYTPAELAAAFHLRYSWTAWPAVTQHFPGHLDRLLEQLTPAWEADGLRLLEYRCRPDLVQVLASVLPTIAPVFCAQRMKGRLEHALRQSGTPVSFSRKLSVTSVGRNCRGQIERYIQEQVAHHRFVDPSWRARLSELMVVDPKVDLAQPTETTRGRYWFNLHLVLITDWRVPISSFATLLDLRDRALLIAQEQGYLVSRLALVPDHLHIALRGPPDVSPEQIALTYLNELADVHGRLWKAGYYAGTFGEYGMAAIRRMSDRKA
jgi:REP element-mobilizing transposase RayT